MITRRESSSWAKICDKIKMNFSKEVFFVVGTKGADHQGGQTIGPSIRFPEPYYIRHNNLNCELTRHFVLARLAEWTKQSEEEFDIELPAHAREAGFSRNTFLFLEEEALYGVVIVSHHHMFAGVAIISTFAVSDDKKWADSCFSVLRKYYREHRKNVVHSFMISPEKNRVSFWKKQGFKRTEEQTEFIEDSMTLKL